VAAVETVHPTTDPAGRSSAAFLAWLQAYRRVWRGSAVSTLLVPILNLLALGYGLGTLVDANGGIDGVSYPLFLAPGLLAAGVMQTAADEGTFPVMGALRWNRTYHAMSATPLTSGDVYLGHLAFVVARAVSGGVVFLLVMLGFGLVQGGEWPLVVPFVALLALAIGAPVMGYSVAARNDEAFVLLYRFVWIPMFLFAGAFFPISQLPGWLQPIARLTPLWHGVELCRGATLGVLTWSGVVVHVLYLAAWGAVGLFVGRRAYRRVLER
jgi:lipooligosaccharide transport system permease protein